MKTVREHTSTILEEITSVLDSVNESEVASFEDRLLRAPTIVLVGAGRVGMAVRGFAMRLAHMGLNAHMIGDATVPSVGVGDLLVVASGSGETQTIYDLVSIAKKNGADIALITGNPESRMGVLSNSIVKIKAPSKVKAVDGFTSIQPMTTLNEQCLGIFFDAIVLDLMERTGETHDTMWARHSNLE
jgi:6-phospho-3-hexuloisomerase